MSDPAALGFRAHSGWTAEVKDGSIEKWTSKGNPRLASLADLRRFCLFSLNLLGPQQLEVTH